MLQQNISLQPYHTFGVSATARWWLEVHSVDDLIEFVTDHRDFSQPIWVLGEGSNVLFVRDYKGLILKNSIKGIDLVAESEDQVILEVGAGENWHKLVQYCIAHGWGGIENLSLIPGSVGAAPVQNIGAYGVELEEVFDSLSCIHLQTGIRHRFDKRDCRFAYRDSVFKQEARGIFFISHVRLRLQKAPHQLRMGYGAITARLKEMQVHTPDIADVSKAVCAIRRSKLPDPKELGNAGSFFKNPVIDLSHFHALQQAYPHIPRYPQGAEKVKIPAGWIIERCGWKGKRMGPCGVHQHQALVLVNYGGASGQQVWDLSERIREDVQRRFGIALEREVNIIPS